VSIYYTCDDYSRGDPIKAHNHYLTKEMKEYLEKRRLTDPHLKMRS
jgi:hypothetical protein